MTFAATPARSTRLLERPRVDTAEHAVGTRRALPPRRHRTRWALDALGWTRTRNRGRDVIPRQRRHFDDDQLGRLASARTRRGWASPRRPWREARRTCSWMNPIVYAGALERVRGANRRETCERGLGVRDGSRDGADMFRVYNRDVVVRCARWRGLETAETPRTRMRSFARVRGRMRRARRRV